VNLCPATPCRRTGQQRHQSATEAASSAFLDGSIAGNRGQTNYAATKAGMIGMTQALAPLFAEKGVTSTRRARVHRTKIPGDSARHPGGGPQAQLALPGGLPVDVAELIATSPVRRPTPSPAMRLRVCGEALLGA